VVANKLYIPHFNVETQEITKGPTKRKIYTRKSHVPFTKLQNKAYVHKKINDKG
jgi:hypothetical protein